MCGLIAKINKNKNKLPVNNSIIDIYEDQYTRGEEGFGILSLEKGNKINLKRATEPAKFIHDLYNTKSTMILAHHRYPTSTRNKLNQTHPIVVDNKLLKYKYYVMHNGIIRNSDELKEKHNKIGFKYTTEIKEKETKYHYKYQNNYNDSEAIAIELAAYVEELEPLLEFEGSAAFLMLQVDKKTEKLNKFYFGRHQNPLNIYREKGTVTISSEGKGEELEEDIIYEENLDPKRKTKKFAMLFPERKIEPKITKYEQKIENEGKTYTTWTKEDQKEIDEYNEGFNEIYTGYPEDTQMKLEMVSEEIIRTIDEFIMELENEETAYTANIEEILITIKTTLKELKGEAIQKFRKQKEEKKKENKEYMESMGFTGDPYKIDQKQLRLYATDERF